nr:MAG TPA: hypothetical protein [Caudoviricetes sp.]
MLIAVFNNLPELILGSAWTGLCFWTGLRVGKWRASK